MQSVMNLKIKFRESFRPFAPSILEDALPDYFEMPGPCASPYMLLVAPLHPGRRRLDDVQSQALQGLDKLRAPRSDVPAITHVDYSARLQTVDAARHGRYHRLLEAFRTKTGCPLLINTSFNVRGEPIVGSPADAYRCFLATNIDALVLEDCVLSKSDQTGMSSQDAAAYVRQFAPD